MSARLETVSGIGDAARLAPGRYYVLVVLMLAQVCAYLDRSVLGVVLPQIKQEFHFGDASLGLLSGLAFAVFYVVFGLPISVLADRGNRRGLIAVSVALWSVMTAFCGLARTFTQLALARVGVGIGEAGLTPPAHSIISDLFPPERRATALSIFSVGIYVGSLIGLAYGGYLAQRFGWRDTFFFMAAPGVVVSIVIALTVREPERGARDRRSAEDPGYRNFPEVLRYLWATPVLRYTLIGITLCSLFNQTLGAWAPSFLVRVRGITIGQAGLILGLTGGVGGVVGSISGARLSEHLGQKDARWRLWVATAAYLVLPISALTFLYTRSLPIIIVTNLIGSTLGAMHVAPTTAALQNLTPMRMRGRAVAVLLLLTALVGGGLGPLLIGAVSDLLAPTFGADSLKLAMTAPVAFALLAAGSYFIAGRKLGAASPRTP
jgi:predicted MFS family arabinose efflux permease